MYRVVYRIDAELLKEMAAATRAKYDGSGVEATLAEVQFHHSLKMHLDVAGIMHIVEGTVRHCLHGESLVLNPRPFFDMYDNICKKQVMEHQEEYVIAYELTNEVYAEILMQLVMQEVECRWMEYWTKKNGRYTSHVVKEGTTMQFFNHNEKIFTLTLLMDDVMVRWKKETALMREEKEKLLMIPAFQKIKFEETSFSWR